ncbi:CCA tRNA nucleotidyltransferase [Halalkalibacillus sediminis]|nr:CCA tRNA nucleotidyltransferase [Halalkalibacillus sediminis]
MLKEPFTHAYNVIDALIQQGFQCYFVGGAVRDLLSGKQVGDIDLATDATPGEMQLIFERTVPIGIEHGTILVLDGEHSFEITTFRTEGMYDDFRHPSHVEFVRDIIEDLSRRDFTINAIAMDRNGELIDPFEGKKDLDNKIIQTVGNAMERFTEDPLRMLRGIRFSSQLGFDIDTYTLDAIKGLNPLLGKVSVERVSVELIKMFQGQSVKNGLSYLNNSNLWLALPVFMESETLIHDVQQKVNRPINSAGTIFAFLHLLQSNFSLKMWAKSYKLSNSIKREASLQIELYNLYIKDGLSSYVLYETKAVHLHPLLSLIELIEGRTYDFNEIQQQYYSLPIKSRDELMITGKDLIDWFPGAKRGKWVGDYMDRIENSILQNQLSNNKEDIRKQVKIWSKQESN